MHFGKGIRCPWSLGSALETCQRCSGSPTGAPRITNHLSSKSPTRNFRLKQEKMVQLTWKTADNPSQRNMTRSGWCWIWRICSHEVPLVEVRFKSGHPGSLPKNQVNMVIVRKPMNFRAPEWSKTTLTWCNRRNSSVFDVQLEINAWVLSWMTFKCLGYLKKPFPEWIVKGMEKYKP